MARVKVASECDVTSEQYRSLKESLFYIECNGVCFNSAGAGI